MGSIARARLYISRERPFSAYVGIRRHTSAYVGIVRIPVKERCMGSIARARLYISSAPCLLARQSWREKKRAMLN
jgi:hypothetical protein